MDRARHLLPALAGAGLLLLAVRPWAAAAVPWPTAWTVLAFAALGLAGWAGTRFAPVLAAAGPPPSSAVRPPVTSGPDRRPIAGPLLIGSVAFFVARAVTGGVPVARWSTTVVGLTVVAAVAEELFFRGFLYDLLHPLGPVVAVVSSAVAFGAVHVSTWGWAVLPLDLAAGLVLSWQRAASGRWAVPAATHVLANLVSLR